MTTIIRQLVLCAVLGCLLDTAHSQISQVADTVGEPVSTSSVVEDPEPVEVVSTNTVAEENPNAAMSRLRGVATVGEFLDLLVDQDGNPITPDTIFSEYDSESGKQVIQGGGRMAEPDDCSPRNMTVRLEMPNADPNDVFFPQCTRMERCGGCCSSQHLQCVPAYTERVSLKVVKARSPFPGSTHLTYSGFAPVIVDRHVRCVVHCTLNAERCGPMKRFVRSQCDCKCRQYKRCRPPHIFSPETCDCECVGGVQDCCAGASQNGGSCGLVFDTRSCRCVLENGRAHIASEITGFQNSTDDFDDEDTSSPEPTTTTTTTTTTATTTPTAQDDPCAAITCPRGLRRVARNGGCSCRPIRRFTGSGGRRRPGMGRPRG
ncbi:uncharacterized protein LOC101849091 [Aplysia californica]|uniref:Uncharacterized protein LOC101849091 n=1 Tax=Aplysia californica TaxID=6500 RepID=A0ABM1ACG7_APLCA|nr:uncharacterized protein LOC101849091 [Aplysia californica]